MNGEAMKVKHLRQLLSWVIDFWDWWLGLLAICAATGSLATIHWSVAIFTGSLMGGLVAPIVLPYAVKLRRLSRLARQLGHPYEGKRQQAFEKLLRMGEQSVPVFLQVLSAPGGKAFVLFGGWNGDAARRLAAEGLGRLKAKEGLEPLMGALNDPNAEVRKATIRALAEIGDRSAIPALIVLLGDWDELVSQVAADSLRKFGEAELVDAFFSVLWKREETALALLHGRFRDEVTTAFMKVLESPWLLHGNLAKAPEYALTILFVAPNAAWALGELGAVEALPMLRSKARLFYPKPLRDACKQAIAKLEPLAKLPRPADATAIRTDTLPRPASLSEVSIDTLPRLAVEGRSNEGDAI